MRIAHSIGALAALAALMVSASAGALERGETRLVRGERAQGLLSSFDDAAWLPTGSPAAKHIYVLYSPGCPISQRMREASRGLEDSVQFRWVPHKLAGAKAVAEHLTEAAMDAAFNGNPPAIQNRARAEGRSAWNRTVVFNNQELIGTGRDSRTSWPTMIYPVDNGVAITVGPTDYGEVASRVAARPEAAELTPAALDAQVPANLTELPQENLVNRRDEPLKLRAVPAASAPVLLTLDTGYQLPIEGRAENGWVAVKALTDGTLAWVLP